MTRLNIYYRCGGPGKKGKSHSNPGSTALGLRCTGTCTSPSPCTRPAPFTTFGPARPPPSPYLLGLIFGTHTMASSGLSRRRVGNAGDDTEDGMSSTQPTTSTAPTTPTGTESRRQAGGSAFEGGHKVAYDPRDMDLDDEVKDGGKMPKLTIMEEVLLLGIKDRAVCT
jgi:hypothetical protein